MKYLGLLLVGLLVSSRSRPLEDSRCLSFLLELVLDCRSLLGDLFSFSRSLDLLRFARFGDRTCFGDELFLLLGGVLLLLRFLSLDVLLRLGDFSLDFF